MLTRLALACLLLTAQTAGSTPTITDAGWFTGCWETTRGPRTVRETWTPPAGATMLATSRTVSGGRTTEYEFIVLRESPRGLEYVAKPSGQPEAVFTSTRVTPDEIVFENPQHDFPTKIVYRRQGADGLLAQVSGTMNGTVRTIEFSYRAVSCGR